MKNTKGNDDVSFDIFKFINSYFDSPDSFRNFIDELLERNQDKNLERENIERQFLAKINLISAIENFMLANWDELKTLRWDNQYSDIVSKTPVP